MSSEITKLEGNVKLLSAKLNRLRLYIQILVVTITIIALLLIKMLRDNLTQSP